MYGSIKNLLYDLELVFGLLFEQVRVNSPVFQLHEERATVLHLLFVQFALIVDKVDHHCKAEWSAIDVYHFIVLR